MSKFWDFFLQESQDVLLFVQFWEVLDSNVEHFGCFSCKLLFDIELGWHNMFLQHCFLFERVITLLIFLIIVEVIVLQVIVIIAREVLLRRFDIVPFFIILAAHCIKAVFIEVVAQWVIIALIFIEYVKSVFIKRTAAEFFNLFLCIFLQ